MQYSSGQCPCPRYWYRVWCFYLRFKTWWFPWHCDTTFFVSKHYISLKLTTLHIMYRATHPHIALAQWEANLQLRTFSFSICWPQWLKTGCQNESTTNICLCGGPSCPFIVLRLWELITELTSSSSSNPMWHISDLSSRLFRSLIIYWNDWWLVRKLLVYLFILFIYFCVWECSDCEEM